MSTLTDNERDRAFHHIDCAEASLRRGLIPGARYELKQALAILEDTDDAPTDAAVEIKDDDHSIPGAGNTPPGGV